MADGYWNRQQASLLPSGGMLKRRRSDYDLTPSELLSRHDMHDYLSRDVGRGEPRPLKDTSTIGSAYDYYLQSAQCSSFTSGEANTFAGDRSRRAIPGGVARLPFPYPGVTGRPGARGPDLVPNLRNSSIGDQLPVDATARPGRETLPLPLDASSTLYVEGFPPDSSKREVARILFYDVVLKSQNDICMLNTLNSLSYTQQILLISCFYSFTSLLDIFRPFVGYKEVRLVIKESKLRGGDPLIFCFVDFKSPACAATALSALQGYRMDEDNPDSKFLRLQFSRNPGPRSISGTRGRR